MPRDRHTQILLPVAAAIAILPLLLQGPSCGHDFTFHILNWFEAAAQFRHGNLHPQWAFSPAWNAGEPRFVFYPPLSWTLGALLGLLMPWTWTPIAYTWLALTASGLAMHRLTRAHATPTAALFASILYLANPYMLFTAYERTAYAELFAAAFLPLLFHAILKPRPTIHAIAIPLALLWLTNAPAAVMGTYTLALLACIRLVQETPWERSSLRFAAVPASRFAATTTAGTLLGFALAAFYILPAATERPLVQIAMVNIPGMRIDDNTVFHQTGITEDAVAHDAVLHTASLIAILLITLTAVILVLTRRRHTDTLFSLQQRHLATPSKRLHGLKADTIAEGPEVSPPGPEPSPHLPPSTVLPLAILTATIALLLTPVTLPIWHHAPELAFLQFPWRLLAVQAVILSLAIALLFSKLRIRRWFVPHRRRHAGRSEKYLSSATITRPLTTTLAAITLAGLLTAAAYPSFRQPCDPEDTVPARLTALQTHQGAEPTDEYTPAPADNDSLHPHNPAFWLSPDPDSPPPPGLPPGPAPGDLTLGLPTSQHLILNLRQYPAWQVTLNGREVPMSTLSRTPRADGLLNLSLPPGTNHLHLTYLSTRLERTAESISAAALLLTFVLLRRSRRERRRR